MEDQVNLTDTLTNCSVTEEQEQFYYNFRWWLEFPGTITIGSIGIAFNSISILTFLSRRMPSNFFNQLLISLAIFDTIYLANRMAESIVTHLIMSHNSLEVYVYCLYPVRSVLMCCSIYLTIALAVERYNALNRPHVYRAHNTSPDR